MESATSASTLSSEFTVTAIISEREALEAGDYPPGTATERQRLARLREIWESESDKLALESEVGRAALDADFAAKLDDLIRTLTKERKIEEAMKVKEFRDNLKKP